VYADSKSFNRTIITVAPEIHKHHQQNQEPTPRWFEADRQDIATWQVQGVVVPARVVTLRLLWPLMLYERATSTVEGFERLINRYLRRWLGVPPSFTSIGLYGRTNQLKLPMTSIVEEFKVAKGRLVVTLKQSTDDLIRKAGIETRA